MTEKPESDSILLPMDSLATMWLEYTYTLAWHTKFPIGLSKYVRFGLEGGGKNSILRGRDFK